MFVYEVGVRNYIMSLKRVDLGQLTGIPSLNCSTSGSDWSTSSHSSSSSSSSDSSLSSSLSTSSSSSLPRSKEIFLALSQLMTTGDSPGDEAVNSMNDSSEHELKERWRRNLKAKGNQLIFDQSFLGEQKVRPTRLDDTRRPGPKTKNLRSARF